MGGVANFSMVAVNSQDLQVKAQCWKVLTGLEELPENMALPILKRGSNVT